jgi:hypothetical protein
MGYELRRQDVRKLQHLLPYSRDEQSDGSALDISVTGCLISESMRYGFAQNTPAPPDIMKTGDSMDKTVRKFASFEEMKDEEFRYWQSVTPAERFAAGHQLSVEGYRAYGYSADGAELKRFAVRIEQARR